MFLFHVHLFRFFFNSFSKFSVAMWTAAVALKEALRRGSRNMCNTEINSNIILATVGVFDFVSLVWYAVCGFSLSFNLSKHFGAFFSFDYISFFLSQSLRKLDFCSKLKIHRGKNPFDE